MAGKHLHLGCHDSEVAAAQAFDQAVMLRHVYCRGGDNPQPLVTNFAPEYYQVRQVIPLHQVAAFTTLGGKPICTCSNSESVQENACSNGLMALAMPSPCQDLVAY